MTTKKSIALPILIATLALFLAPSFGFAQCNPNTDPAFYFSPDKDWVNPGESVQIDIMFGTQQGPRAVDFQNIHLSFGIDTNQIKYNSIIPDFDNSWIIGNDLANPTIDTTITPSAIQMSITRSEFDAISGWGPIASVIVGIDDNIVGGALLDTIDLVFTIDSVIDIVGNMITTCQLEYQIVIADPSYVSIDDLENAINIYPNPINGSNKLFVEAKDFEHAIITDITGKQILSANLKEDDLNEIDVATLSNGMYFITLVNNNKTLTKQFVIID